MSDLEEACGMRPTRRVTFEVTAYWKGGVVAAGWYDMQTAADSGQTFSIPQGAVDEATIRDAPPEELTGADWSEISGYVRERLGPERADRMLELWRHIADDEHGELARFVEDAHAPTLSRWQTPETWCNLYGLVIADPDGWREKDAPPWDTPIRLAEFWARFNRCTVRQVPEATTKRILADLADGTS